VLDELAPKDASITDVVARLRDRLGAGAFILADHWADDLCAVGLAATHEPGRLVYITTLRRAPGRYDLFFELPPPPGSELPYEPAGNVHDIGFEQLAAAVAQHLGLSPSRPAG
jgi:hypothetical protein